MKKISLILVLTSLCTLSFVGATVIGKQKDVVAEETVHKVSEIPNIEVEATMNPTIQQAIERAKIDPEFWDFENESEDSETILAVGGGFLKGEMEDSATGTIYNSDTDPDATTLGEIREAVSEYTR